jgi:hypothetical protein
VDDRRFDEIAKLLAGSVSRRSTVRSASSALGAMFGLLGLTESEAGKKKGKRKGKGKKKRCSGSRKCGKACCGKGQFCCDDARKVCCADNAECCNLGSGTGSCCSPPNRCAKPIGNDAAPFECCPPERQFTGFGVIRCCPGGTRSLGTEISSDDGPCCPEGKYCSTSQTGGKCCPDVAPICLNRGTGQCCNEDAACGTTCCSGEFGDCCNGQCWDSNQGPWTPCGSFCCWKGTECCAGGVCCDPATHVCVPDCLGPGMPSCCPKANPGCCGNG